MCPMGGNRVISPAPKPKGGWIRMPSSLALLGIAVGVTLYYFMARGVGVHVEIWEGVNTFTNFRWFAAVALVPAVSGFVTGIIAGHNGKWYGMVPVALMHPADYFATLDSAGAGVTVLSPGLFIFFMIIMLELGLMAGWVAEMVRARISGEDKRA